MEGEQIMQKILPMAQRLPSVIRIHLVKDRSLFAEIQILKRRIRDIWASIYQKAWNPCAKNLGSMNWIVRRMTEEEKNLPKRERERVEKRLQCFVPLNARASNEFRDRSVLVYAANLYTNPYVRRFFELKNKADGTNIISHQKGNAGSKGKRGFS